MFVSLSRKLGIEEKQDRFNNPDQIFILSCGKFIDMDYRNNHYEYELVLYDLTKSILQFLYEDFYKKDSQNAIVLYYQLLQQSYNQYLTFKKRIQNESLASLSTKVSQSLILANKYLYYLGGIIDYYFESIKDFIDLIPYIEAFRYFRMQFDPTLDYSKVWPDKLIDTQHIHIAKEKVEPDFDKIVDFYNKMYQGQDL